MTRSFLVRWGFTIAGVSFMFAGLVPLLDGRNTNVPLFIIGLTFLVIGARIARKNQEPR